MSRYRKIDPRFWNDEKVRQLTDDGRYVFLFLLTHPSMTALGAMRATLPGLAAELGWTVSRFCHCLAPAIKHGMVIVNKSVAYLSLPHFLRYNPPVSPNAVKAWVAALDFIPECQQRSDLIAMARESLSGAFLEAFDKAFHQAFPDAFPKPSVIPSLNHDLRAKSYELRRKTKDFNCVGEVSPNCRTEPHPPATQIPADTNGHSPAHVVLEFLNAKANRHYRPVKTNLKLIEARLADGITEQQLKAIVTRKVAKWAGDPKMDEFLRPATLFGRTNCEQYRGELPP